MKVLIIEDEPMIIDVLTGYLLREGYHVISETNGQAGLELFHHEQPDFVLLDLMLPDLSGEEICENIRRVSNVPILILSAKSAEEERIRGLRLGADDYVTKPFSPREVLVRMQTVLRRTGVEPKEQLPLSFNQSMLIIDDRRKLVKIYGQEIHLTRIEYVLLHTMASHPGQVFHRTALLEAVQADQFFEGYERSIDVHIKNLRKKIETDPRHPRLIVTVFGMGYKFGGEEDVSHTTG
ncbi:DNA-binding response regulator [Alkalicoccus saliphilus]|uniref:DNA-binding response regulator n=1 Tax=Alkalicoccus saliphilus TaxID=200989 RepID=A0A2T4U3Q3_9BACI|nr:DNA-binding response regulator [Alkalicoccus saliphilus]